MLVHQLALRFLQAGGGWGGWASFLPKPTESALRMPGPHCSLSSLHLPGRARWLHQGWALWNPTGQGDTRAAPPGVQNASQGQRSVLFVIPHSGPIVVTDNLSWWDLLLVPSGQ